MTDKPPRESGTLKEFLVFLVKLVALFAGLTAFGFVVYWLRRQLH